MLSDSNTYETTNMDVNSLRNKVIKFIDNCQNEFGKNIFTKNELKALKDEHKSIAYIYGSPKVHKSKIVERATKEQNTEIIICQSPEDLTFRPVVSTRNCPTGPLADLIDKLMTPFLQKIPHRLRDTWDFLNRQQLDTTKDAILITADIASLYTNIDNIAGIDAINYFCTEYPELLQRRFPKKFLLKALEFCQENLYFTFKEKCHRQRSGCGMGRTYSGAYSDLKVAHNEIKLKAALIIRNIPATTAEKILSTFRRFLDDIFLMWERKFGNPKLIESALNSLDSKLHYDIQTSEENGSVPFLDVLLSCKNGKITTDIYHKPTDSFNYLPFYSCHARHTKINIPFSLATRICGIVSNPQTRNTRLQQMQQRLLNKKYPLHIIQKGIKRALSLKREDIINPNHKHKKHSHYQCHLINTFNPNIVNPFRDILNTLNSYKTNSDFIQNLKVTNGTRQPPNLKRSFNHKNKKFTTKATPMKYQVKKCNRPRCKTCHEILEGSEHTFGNGKKAWCNTDITCYTANIIYAIICENCKKFYIGETGDPVCIRNTVHRQQIRSNATHRPVEADIHIETCSGGRYKIFPFFQPSRNDMSLRRQLESHMIQTLRPELNNEHQVTH